MLLLLPLWLAPVQVAILPISERHSDTALTIESKLDQEKFRTKSDLRNEKVNAKIRKAQLEKVPYMVIIGDKEVEQETLSVRNRFEGDLGSFSFEKFLELLQDLRERKLARP